MTIKIAVDIMGGDNAPKAIVEGALNAAKLYNDIEIILVGNKEAFPEELPANVKTKESFSVMAMDEPVDNLHSKRDSSIWVATELVKTGEADAIVSAGSTGAQMASAMMLLKRIKGVKRPSICVLFPTLAGVRAFTDTGANTEVTEENLYQFARMATVYCKTVLKIDNPRVALLSNGTEEGKGTETVVATHKMLKASDLNFIGNKEGRDVPFGDFDVMVTDGFSGNITIKVAEGVSSVLFKLLKQELTSSLKNKIGAVLVKPALRKIKKMFDYSEHGGAPLLGVNGVSIVCHGGSNALAIQNAVRVAKDCVESEFIDNIAKDFQNEMAKAELENKEEKAE